jgi:hypothetical protein
VSGDNGEVFVASAYGPTYINEIDPVPNAEMQVANAHLIAAAPDLLAACRAFLEKWQRQGLANLQLEKFDTLARQMEAAVEAAACPSHVEVKPVELAAVACRPTSPHVSPAAHQEGGALGGAPESGD